MKNMTLTNLAQVTGGELKNADERADREAQGIVLDSRKMERDYLFIATRGERVDGHSFIDAVCDKGALGVICEEAPAHPRCPYLLVKDSFQALKDIAAYYREQLDVKVVGITGSVGKTSTKECIASVLATKYRVLKTEGNFNNEVGLPLTVLRIRDDVDVAVLEMGISNFGEMHRLSYIAKPDVCVITNIGQCHLENLGTRDGILRAKSEIFDYIAPDACICLNGDDDKLITLQNVQGRTPLFFGKKETHPIYATDYVNRGLAGGSVTIHRDGRSFAVTIPLPGEHMVYNTLAAAAVGTVLGLSDEQIAQGIASVEPVGGRSHIISEDNVTIIDDCYNANPVSMKAAIDLLAMADTRKVAILGDMFELGANEAALHEEVGSYAAYRGIDVICCVGGLSRRMYEGARAARRESQILYLKDRDDVLAQLPVILHDGDTVLVKASHGMHFEEVVNRIANL